MQGGSSIWIKLEDYYNLTSYITEQALLRAIDKSKISSFENMSLADEI